MTLEHHILNTIYLQKKGHGKIKILFPEGDNEKVQAAALKLVTNSFISDNNEVIQLKTLFEPILLFAGGEKIPKTLKEHVTIIEMVHNEKYNSTLANLRKEKGLTLEMAAKLLTGKNYYGIMLLHEGIADCLVGGINYRTADILIPAFQIIKPLPEVKKVASCFIMNRESNNQQETYIFGDCAINMNPDVATKVQTAIAMVELARTLKLKMFDPKNFAFLKLAVLSYSTNGSGAGFDVVQDQTVVEQLRNYYHGNNDIQIVGETQFDAAFVPEVRAKKFSSLKFDGSCNVYLFPDLEAGNIGYKIAQRFGNFNAIGPIILGLNKPVNDLSRGASETDIYFTALISATQTLIKR